MRLIEIIIIVFCAIIIFLLAYSLVRDPYMPFNSRIYNSMDQLDFLEKTLNETNNSNIFILTHHPIVNTTYRSYQEKSIDESYKVLSIVKNYSVSCWFHGHLHNNNDLGQDPHCFKHGIHFFNVGSITYYMHGSSYNSSADSMVMFLEKGSNIVRIRSRNHSGGSWREIYDYNISLPYAFDYPQDAVIWLFSDVHTGLNHSIYMLDQAITDVNQNISNVTLSFCIGDMIHNYYSKDQWDLFHIVYDKLNSPLKYYTLGNHEIYPDLVFYDSVRYPTFYNVSLGNVEFICLNPYGVFY
jgi:hypothetical protein